MPEEEEVVFRLLLSNDRVGGVIGKGGTVVRAIEEETGASIRVAAHVPESHDRIIHISAMENLKSQYSPAQNAVNCVFERSIEVGKGTMLESGATKDLMAEARLLIELDKTGCLIGVGGTVISEMRKATRTSMWILQGDQMPPCAAENDSVVKTMTEENLRGFMNTGRGVSDLRGSVEYSSGSKSALVTNTTLEILVPKHLFGSVSRKKESNLSCLRQISGAKINLHDPFPGSSEAMLVISGTPDQTQVAECSPSSH